MRFAPLLACLLLALATQAASAASPPSEGSKAFTARPKIGAAVFNLPASLRWRSTALPGGRYRVMVDASVDVASVLANIKTLSAQALNRDVACATLVRVQNAAAKITSARTVRYDLRFRYAKRVCAGGMPLELPADVTCAATISLRAAKSTIMIDVQGATAPPCRIEGAATAVSDAIYGLVGIDVFKRHVIDVAKVLPKEFQGVTIDIRALAFDVATTPALHIAGQGTMNQAQFAALMTRLSSTAPAN